MASSCFESLCFDVFEKPMQDNTSTQPASTSILSSSARPVLSRILQRWVSIAHSFGVAIGSPGKVVYQHRLVFEPTVPRKSGKLRHFQLMSFHQQFQCVWNHTCRPEPGITWICTFTIIITCFISSFNDLRKSKSSLFRSQRVWPKKPTSSG